MRQRSKRINVGKSNLIATGLTKCDSILEDINLFEENAVTAEMVNDLRSELLALDADIKYLEEQKTFTSIKKEEAENLRFEMERVVAIAAMALSPENQSNVLINRMNVLTLSDKDLLCQTKILLGLKDAIVADTNQHKVIIAGFEKLENMYAAYSTAFTSAQNFKTGRKQATNNRNDSIADIKNRLANYCRIGRAIWRNKDIAKYESYMLSFSPPNRTKKNPVTVTNLVFANE